MITIFFKQLLHSYSNTHWTLTLLTDSAHMVKRTRQNSTMYKQLLHSYSNTYWTLTLLSDSAHMVKQTRQNSKMSISVKLIILTKSSSCLYQAFKQIGCASFINSACTLHLEERGIKCKNESADGIDCLFSITWQKATGVGSDWSLCFKRWFPEK